MQPFSYIRAGNLQSAIEALAAAPSSRFVAGGTNLLDMMKLDVETPQTLIDISALPLNQIEPTPAGGLRLGALVSNSDAAWHPRVREHYPLLSQAILAGGSTQIRNMASVGGNLMQRTRCPYFRNTAFACNKREPGSGCSALAGHHRMHAILGGSEQCIATHASDMAVALAALDAVVHLYGPAGKRTLPLNDFYLTPGATPQRETQIAHGEMITAVELPPLPFAARSHYLKLRDRAAFEFALVAVACALDIRDGAVVGARLALGGVATKPWRAYEAEKRLMGAPLQPQAFQAAADTILADAVPLRDNHFKVELTHRAVVRALNTVAQAQ